MGKFIKRKINTMKLTTALTFLLGSTTSFTPILQSRNFQSVTRASSVEIPGALPPAGFFDPLGLAEKATDATLLRYREAEVTHGRVAMLATIGFLVGEKVEGSSFLFDASIKGPAITHLAQVPAPFWIVLGSTILGFEQYRAKLAFVDPADVPTGQQGLMREDHYPGDIGFDPLGLKPENTEEFNT